MIAIEACDQLLDFRTWRAL